MEMSSQLHTLAAFFQVKRSPEAIEKGALVDSSADLDTFGREENVLCLPTIKPRFSFRSAQSLFSYRTQHLIWGLGTGYSEKLYFVTARNITVLFT